MGCFVRVAEKAKAYFSTYIFLTLSYYGGQVIKEKELVSPVLDPPHSQPITKQP